MGRMGTIRASKQVVFKCKNNLFFGDAITLRKLCDNSINAGVRKPPCGNPPMGGGYLAPLADGVFTAPAETAW